MASRNYRDLIAWQRAMELVDLVYQLTSRFPRDELFGLTSQLKRASISIASNIAEGQGRVLPRDFRRFLRIAYGSLREVETQILIGQRQHFLGESDVHAVLDKTSEIGRLINGLLRSLERKLTEDPGN